LEHVLEGDGNSISFGAFGWAVEIPWKKKDVMKKMVVEGAVER